MKDRVLDLLSKEDVPLKLEEIDNKLGLTTSDELRALQDVLEELKNEMEVYQTKKNKYILYTKCPNFRKGKLSINKKGFGFLLLEDAKEEDIHISHNNLGLALNNDIVLVEIIDAEKWEGRVLKVLKRDLNNIVGSIKSDGKELYFEPLEKMNIELKVDASSISKCVEGEIVVVSILGELGNNKYIGEVSNHICHKDDPAQDILTIAAKYAAYNIFPESAINQANSLPNEVIESDKADRRDLTDKMIFTIDGKTTKDIDDAISLTKEDNLYHLGVHIADVSYYVTEASPLDIEAYNRGTSFYLAYSVIPMLPHILSNGICSLNPNVERLSLTCDMTFDKDGNLIDSDIYQSIIKSNIKMNYDDVNSILEQDIIPEGYEPFAKTLKDMQELAHILRERRTKRGASDFDVEEPYIVCNDDGVAIDVLKRSRGEGERLIEDFMIAANECVAETLSMLDVPSVYRVHDKPKEERIQSFISFCMQTGHIIKGKFNNNITPVMYQKLLSQIDVSEEEKQIFHSLAVRTMPKAFYSTYNIGHFGLASTYYTHFTSPIRRYPDLQVHRLLRTYLFEGKMDLQTINYWESNLDAITRHSSEREEASVEAEREVDKMKMAEYMEQHIGEEFVGIISGVTNFGMFIQLNNLVEGLVPVTSLQGDYFECIPEMQSLIGKSTKKMYTIGMPLKVKCVAASKEESKIDFEIVSELSLEDKGNTKRLNKKV